MSTVILTTVGTSLLMNARREAKVADHEIMEYLSRDPKSASAETNSLLRIRQRGDSVVLLHSDTPEGERAATLLELYLQDQKVECRKVRIVGLAYEAQGFVDYGLKHFVQTLAAEIRRAKREQKEVIINATGGFKAEIAYATALGLVFKVPVYYIHEKFGDVVTLPPSPFGWDSELIAWNHEFFDWIDAELRPKREVESRAAGLPEALRVLLEDFELDGQVYTSLSPLGQAYLEAFRGELEQAQTIPIYLAPKARRTWEGLEPAEKERYRKLLQRLRLPNRAANSERKSGGGDALGFPKGNTDERVFYAEKEGALYVFALTHHGPEYDRMCQEGFRWSDYADHDFTLWEG
ncbi:MULTISPECIES: putative CRISPR-associated protein [unclassified Meiothermus]|uniref:putative CRISPR-associated protein n=1 Tax=unclassified Meiothermus TaxID=370471 RepID=UPI000D7C4B94|nr:MULTISPECIES: putative CRISPR-associated protein [unclassified Meiothermus]PZA07713.1 CRISPR-associated protein [Meiothermus sp. Pnk-1]RYM34473.1 putative CRISPR-associated protein [Meiothermus sp. PNK-Is4]